MRELSHLVSSSSVVRARLHRSRSPSPIDAPAQSARRGILRGSRYVGAPAGEKFGEEMKHLSPSPSSSPSRSRRRPAASTTVLPTASRATLASLRTFLHSPPRTGLRVRPEMDPQQASAIAHEQLDRALDGAADDDDDDDSYVAESLPVHHGGTRAGSHHHMRVDSASSLSEAVLDSPSGRHTLSAFFPTHSLQSASSSAEAFNRDQTDRNMRRSLHASQLQH